MNITTLELVSRAQAAGDMHDAPISPAQWMYWATQENIALCTFIAQSGWTENVKTLSFTITGSEAGVFPLTNTPTIPNIMAIVAVHESGTNGLRPIKLNNAVDFLRQMPGSSTIAPAGSPTEYRVVWDQDNTGASPATDRLVLNFYPEPSAGKVFVVSYIQHPLKLTLDAAVANVSAASVNYPLGWEERIVLGMAKRAVQRETGDTSDLRADIRAEDARIEAAVWNRVMAESPSVRNTDNVHRGWNSKFLYAPPTQWWWA